MVKEKFSEGILGFVISCALFIGLLIVDKCSNPGSNMYIHFVKSHQLWLYISLIGVFVIQQTIIR